MISLSALLIEIFSDLQSKNIPYCVLRNHEKLPAENVGRDIDILVPKCHVDEIIDSVQSIKGTVVTGITCRQNMTAIYLYGVNNGRYNAIEIDLITARTWKGFEYLSVERILNDTKKGNMNSTLVNSPSEYHEAIISLLGHYLATGRIKPKYETKIKTVFLNQRENVEFELASSIGRRRAKQFVKTIAVGSQKEIKSFKVKILIGLVISGLLNNPRKSIFGFFAHIWKELTLWVTKCNSTTVVFLGPDGAGKSTLIERTVADLTHTANVINQVHLKPTYFFGKRKSQRGTVTDPHGSEPRSKFTSIIKVLIWFLEIWFEAMINRPKNLELTVYDRYFDDILVDPFRYRYGASLRIVEIFRRLIPSPDIYIICVADPEVIQGRKQEVSLRETRRQVILYKRICQNLNGVLIDTALPINQSLESCRDAILEVIKQKARN